MGPQMYALQLFLVRGLVKVVTVIYQVLHELSPYAKCDYVIDLMASIKTLLCDLMIRGLIMIQYACGFMGTFLFFFVILTTQGCKRWIKSASVSPDVVNVKPQEA